jgi:hypothetical protein
MRRTTESSSTTSKRVEWNERCRIRRIDIPDKEDRFNAWYQADDYDSFKEEIRVVLRLARAIGRKSIEKTDYVSCRGVERLLTKKHTRIARLERKRQARGAVLYEQLKQWENGTNSPEVIAWRYQRVTRPCQEHAHKLAIKYWNEETQEPIKDGDKESSDIESRYPMFAAKKNTLSSTPHQTMAHLQQKVLTVTPRTA